MQKFKSILLENIIVIIYFVLAILLELFGSLLTDQKFYIRDVRYLFTVLGIVVAILLLIKKQKTRIALASIFLIVQGVINIVFIVLFEMAGQWFDFSMFSLRNDAMGILESIPINFWFFFFLMLGLSAFVVFGLRLSKHIRTSEYSKKTILIKNIILSFLIVAFLGLNVLTASAIHSNKEDMYMNILKSDKHSKYNQYGIMSNFINEIYGGTLFSKEQQLKESEILDFLYKEESDLPEYFGVSEGNNVITILGETFEWFSFITDKERYPKGLDLTDEQTTQLFPNFMRLYNESYILNNYYAREKTDISENYSIVGSYPINSYINYDYPDNDLPQTMPNTLRNEYKDSGFVSRYFHDGYASFYNRNDSVLGLGFDECYTTEKILKLDNNVMKDYGADGERNLDSEMVESCKELMFPTDKKFYTYITTITTHGMYAKRDNLKEHYDKMLTYGMDIDTLDEEKAIFYTYVAAALELDKMLGLIFNYLEENDLIDKTTIVIFGDHQGYYQGLSNYVKGISTAKQSIDDKQNYMELYRVPCMIYDQKLVKEINNTGGNRISNKFSSSCDIVPTLLGMLGIKHFKNTYYGNSIFTDTQSLVYSRGYGYFLDEYSYFYNLNTFTYINDSISNKEEYKKQLQQRGEILVEKIRHIDQSFKGKIFNKEDNFQNYFDRLGLLNQ